MNKRLKKKLQKSQEMQKAMDHQQALLEEAAAWERQNLISGALKKFDQEQRKQDRAMKKEMKEVMKGYLAKKEEDVVAVEPVKVVELRPRKKSRLSERLNAIKDDQERLYQWNREALISQVRSVLHHAMIQLLHVGEDQLVIDMQNALRKHKMFKNYGIKAWYIKQRCKTAIARGKYQEVVDAMDPEQCKGSYAALGWIEGLVAQLVSLDEQHSKIA